MKLSGVPKLALGNDLLIATMIIDDKPERIKEKVGMVLRIERSSVHDGDGFRTVIFLKGCPLRCAWCSTPESQSCEIEYAEGKTYGQQMTVEQVMAEVRKDSLFYFHSNGGLTISGGEPFVHSDFVATLLKQAQSEGISTAIETCLAVPFSSIEKSLPYLDIMYADIKHIDNKKHKQYCGMEVDCILDNVRRIDARANDIRLIIRIPLIPGINDDPDTLHGIGSFCGSLKNMYCVQLLPYHRLGVDTYRKLGRDYPLADIQVPSDEHMEACRKIVRSYVGAC